MTNVLISYDITLDAKRDKVAGILKDYGNRVQYSVFECHVDARSFTRLLAELKPYASDGDSIRVYQLCQGCLEKAIELGQGKIEGEPGFHLV